MTSQEHGVGHSAFGRAVNDGSSVIEQNAMALVIDVQGLSGLDRIDAQNFVDKLAETLTSLRDGGTPVTWVAMRKGAGLYEPTETDPSAPVQVRDISELRDMGFSGVDSEQENHDIYSKFLSEHGPRTNEAVACKSVKSALLEEVDASGKDDYTQMLEGECGQELSDYFGGQKTLTDYMREQNVNSTILMGAVSSHCISETAVSGALKGFAPQVMLDRVLSWQGEESSVNPRTSMLLWRGSSSDTKSWDAYHQEKIETKISEIESDKSRSFQHNDLDAIHSIKLATSESISSSLSHTPKVDDVSSVLTKDL